MVVFPRVSASRLVHVAIALVVFHAAGAVRGAKDGLATESDSRRKTAASANEAAAASAANCRRIQLLAQARRNFLRNNVESAFALASQALQLDRDLFGAHDDRVAWRLRDLATYSLELEQPEQALRLAREAADLVRASHGETSWQVDDTDRFVEVASSLAALPRTKRQRFLDAARRVELADEQQDLGTALKATQFRAGVLIELFGDQHASVAKELVRMQDLLIQMRDIQTVERQLYRLEKLFPQIARVPSPDFARLFLAWALLAEAKNDAPAAELQYRRAIEMFSAAGLPFDVDYPVAHNNYAVLLEQLGRPDEAMRHYRTASELWTKELDSTCWTFRKIQDNLVQLEENAGHNAIRDHNWAEAESHFAEALSVVDATWGRGDYRVPELHAELDRIVRLRTMTSEELERFDRSAQLLAESESKNESGANDEALSLARTRREIVVELFGEASLDAVRAQYWIAWLNPDVEAALESYAPLADAMRQLLGDAHPEYADVLCEVARYSEEDDPKQIDRVSRAAAIYAASVGKDSWDYADAVSLLGRLLRKSHDAGAESVLLEAQARRQSLGDTSSAEYVDVLFDLASYYAWRDQPLTSMPYAAQAIEIARRIPDYDASELSTLVNELANAYFVIEQYDRALELYVEAIDLERNAPERSECDFRMLLRNTGELYFNQEDYASAEKFFRELFDACASDSLSCEDSCLDGAISLSATYRRQERFDELRPSLDRLEKLLQGERVLDASVVCEYQAKLDMHRVAIARDRGEVASARKILAGLWERLASAKELTGAPLPAQTARRQSRGAMAPLAWSQVLGELRDIADSLEESAAGVAIRAAYVQYVQQHEATRPWLIAEARCDLREARQRQQFTGLQRQRLREADELWDQALEVEPADFARTGLPMMEQAVAMRSSVLGRLHRQVATSLLEWAWRELDSGRAERAYSLYREGVELTVKLLGEVHPETAVAKRDAAMSARKTSRFDEAEGWLQEALSAQRRALGSDHVDLADTYHGLAILYLSMGRYASALPAAIEASRRYELRDGEQSYNHANALRTLFAVYDELGETERASEVLIQSHNIIKNLYQPSDPEYLDSIHAGAAFAGRFTATFELAEQLYQQLFSGLKEAKLEHTERYADALNMYGNLCRYRGDFTKARKQYEQALALRESIYDQPDHRLIAQLHGQLGSTALRLGDLAAAEASLETACKLRRERLGDNSHENITSFYQLAFVKALQHDGAAALQILTRCLEIEQLSLDENFLQGSEAAIAEELDDNDDKFALLLSLQASPSASPESVDAALGWTLGRKGLALDMACRLQAAKRSFVHQPEIIQALAEIQTLRESLAETAISVGQDQDPASLVAARKSALQRIADLQEQMAFRVRDAGLESGQARVDVSAIRSRLPPESALVEYVVAKLADLDSPRGEWRPEHVLAFYLAADPNVPCRLVDLGPADRITALIDALRAHIERLPRSIRVASPSELEQQFFSTSETLYQLLLGPFAPDLADLKYVILAPDGDLHRVPFAALSPHHGRYLIEQIALSYVSSGRDLLRDHAQVGKGALILADPDYDATQSERAAVASSFDRPWASPLNGPSVAAPLLALRSDEGGELRSLRWRALPGARQEAADVRLLFGESSYGPVQFYVGSEATEEVFKATISPRLVHIATHGFYVPYEEATDGSSSTRGQASGTGLGRLRGDENPLLRSGVVLAGANQLPDAGEETLDVDDGWVTAQEIASMDFRNTELVVLSACESGLGEAKLGHGVHGLRRALAIAGAHNVMTSLFEVPDKETRELMNRFYHSLVTSGRPAAALHEAQRSMIDKLRSENNAAHPFYWASFFVLGNPQRVALQ